MRQLLNWRFFLTLGALLLLALGVDGVFGTPDQSGTVAFATPADLDGEGDVIRRRIDLIEPVERFEVSDDFEVGPDGLTVGVLDAVLDANRVMRVAPGTPGSVTCRNLIVPERCVVMADVLGDAVIWFAVLPKGPRETVELPPIIDLQDGYALFENGWEVLYPPVIDRECEGQDIPSFSDFLRRFGPGSTTIVDLETRQVLRVECDLEYVAPATIVEFDGSLNATIDLSVGPTTTIETLDPEVVAPDN